MSKYTYIIKYIDIGIEQPMVYYSSAGLDQNKVESEIIKKHRLSNRIFTISNLKKNGK